MRPAYNDREEFRINEMGKSLDYPLHLHSAVEIIVMLRGECLVTVGDEKRWIRAGDIFVVFPNQIHAYEQSRDVNRYMLILPLQAYLEPYRKLLTEQRPVDPVLPAGSWEHTGLLPLLHQAVKDDKTASAPVRQGYALVILGKLLPLLKLERVKSGQADALDAILRYIHSHYKEQLSRSAIAKATGYNESYVSHVFSQSLGQTLPAYIAAMRLEDAMHLLRSSNKPITDIASELGFGSIRSFNRSFLKQTGVSPKMYRNS